VPSARFAAQSANGNRDLARACAANRVAIPCHRVVSKNGKLSGYRRGVERKKKLLEMEKSVAANA